MKGQKLYSWRCCRNKLPPGVTSTNKVLEMTIKAGARLAEPGEFTKRLFKWKNRLISGRSSYGFNYSKDRFSNEVCFDAKQWFFIREIGKLNEYLLNVLALIDYAVDFTEDEEEIDPSIPLELEMA